MDADALSALVNEAAKKSDLIWVRAAEPGYRSQAMWHLWQDGAFWLLTGGLEQPAPEDLAERALVTLRSKDKGSRLTTIEADVSVVDPASDDWAAIAKALQTERLNLPDSEQAQARWARECTLYRLVPTGAVVETPDDPSTTAHRAAPPPTPARSRVPRPWHLRGRPSRNRGGM
jgi:hypothetical protein